MTRLDEIAARLEAEPDGPDLCPVSECEVCTQVRDARALLAAVREVATLHRPVPDGWGFIGDSYGTVSPACGTCGTHSEYAVPWPCPTARAVQALTTTEETR